VVFPDQVGKFFSTTPRNVHWVAWNLAFDWWVLYQHFKMPWVKKWMTRALECGYFHDAMLMEQLVRLAEGRDGEGMYQRSLYRAAIEYLGYRPRFDKESIRTEFTPDMVGRWEEHRQAWEYAAEDAYLTYRLSLSLWAGAVSARKLIPAWTTKTLIEDHEDKFGLLTEGIQSKAAVALAAVTRNGFRVSHDEVAAKAAKTYEECLKALTWLDGASKGQLIKKYVRTGEPRITKGTGLPQLSLDVVRKLLLSSGVQNVPSTDKSDKPTTAASWWSQHRGLSDTIDRWCDYETGAKDLGLLRAVEQCGDSVHSRYTTIVSTGRSSARSPNIQQIPRDGWFRAFFRARPGHKLVICDYSFIELRTLAAILERRYVRSRLADVIRDGIDPHAYTAALVCGLELSEFLKWKDTNPEEFKRRRQAAKAINFGVPGGLGAKRLGSYAHANYGVTLTEEESRTLRGSLIYNVYPELSDQDGWLADGLPTRLSGSLGVDRSYVARVLGLKDEPFFDPAEHPMARLLRGETTTAKGPPFREWYVNKVWEDLDVLISAAEGVPTWVVEAVRTRTPGVEIASYLFQLPAVTLTGRIRQADFYGEYRNTQFQGLAADGAKLALWRLIERGYKVVAFIHDEIVTEVPDATAEEDQKEIERIMCLEFSGVVGGLLPIAVESRLSDRWEK
jgi:DNA polymerase I-like protein with 3'-5' exonuclease and polymerase domains